MEQFAMEIAGIPVGVESLFETTKAYCRAYLTENRPVCHVRVTAEALAREQALLDREADEEGLKRRKFPDPFLERSVIQRAVADALLPRGILMLHGSTVAVDGRAYLFTAPCGTGKSTHTRLWRQVFGARAVMVNDDKPFLEVTAGGVIAHGAPWSGKHGLDANIQVPLGGICILRRGPENVIEPMAAEDALARLRHQAHAPEDPVLAEKAQALADALAYRVPMWKMACNKEEAAARVAYEAMSGGRERIK